MITEIIASLISILTDLIPRWKSAAEGESLLIEKRGVYSERKGPVFMLTWPFWTKATEYHTNRSPTFVELNLDDGEGNVKTAQLNIVYEIVDLVLAAKTSSDWGHVIDDECRICIIKNNARGGTVDQLRRDIRESMAGYGIRVLKIAYNAYSVDALNMRHSGNIYTGG